MNSNDYSSGNLRNNEPWFTTYGQPTGENNPTQPPSISSAGLRNFQRNVLTDDQYIAAEDYNGQAPSYSAFQHGGGNSINQFTNKNGYRGGYQTNDGVQAPDFDAFERQNNSGTTGFNDYYGYEQAPSYSGVAPRNPSIPGVQNMNMNLGDNVGISLVGRNFQRAKLMELYKDRDMY